ncbi:MAG: hypothetical protein WCC90_21090 [Methylocella sp.]
MALAGQLCLPVCGGREHSHRQDPRALPMQACRRQTSPIAGTIFAASKLPLRTWFRAIYQLTQSKGGMGTHGQRFRYE